MPAAFFNENGKNALDFKPALIYDQDFKTDCDVHFGCMADAKVSSVMSAECSGRPETR